MRWFPLSILVVALSNGGEAEAVTSFEVEATGGVSFIDTSIESRDFLVGGNESSSQGAWSASTILPTIGARIHGRIDSVFLEGSLIFAGLGDDSDSQFFLNSVAGDFDEENVGTANYDFDTDLRRVDARLDFGYRYQNKVDIKVGAKLAVTELDRDGDFAPLELNGGLERSDVSSTLRLIEYGPSLGLGFLFGDDNSATDFWVDGRVSYLFSELDIDFEGIQQLDVESDGTTLGLGLSLGADRKLTEDSRVRLSIDGEVYDGRQDDGPDVETSILRLRASYIFVF